jgi:hypothetical protein
VCVPLTVPVDPVTVTVPELDVLSPHSIEAVIVPLPEIVASLATRTLVAALSSWAVTLVPVIVNDGVPTTTVAVAAVVSQWGYPMQYVKIAPPEKLPAKECWRIVHLPSCPSADWPKALCLAIRENAECQVRFDGAPLLRYGLTHPINI